MSDPIAAERCPTCDRRRVSLAEIDTALDCDHGLACVCPRDHCWSPLTGECVGRLRMHWRDRALAAEAERDEWAGRYSAMASEVAAWQARAEAAEDGMLRLTDERDDARSRCDNERSQGAHVRARLDEVLRDLRTTALAAAIVERDEARAQRDEVTIERDAALSKLATLHAERSSLYRWCVERGGAWNRASSDYLAEGNDMQMRIADGRARAFAEVCERIAQGSVQPRRSYRSKENPSE